MTSTPGMVGQPILGDEEDYRLARKQMVSKQLRSRGIQDPLVLQAMLEVPRHLFIPPSYRAFAYDDGPLPIGHDQTISQPYIVAFMTEHAKVLPSHKVLEIGTGSGYQAAILSRVVAEVYTIEIVTPLGLRAQETLKALGHTNVKVRVGDGYGGWPEAAPFDAILLTAAPPRIPPTLLNQLKEGGCLVAPLGGGGHQRLIRVTRSAEGFREEHLLDVRFVPMTGKIQENQ